APLEPSATKVTVEILMENDGESFARRPDVDPTLSNHDVILVVGGLRIPENKQVLSAQSSYFNSLFFGHFKESNQEEIELKDTDPDDFNQLLKMSYGISTEPSTVQNAIRYLMMADMFDLQIVKDRVHNFLLTTTRISIHRKVLIAEEHK
ncbi:hypothetical protein PENTCL1PPCAC_13147, partial [Pristionchus entomophagus]